MASARGGWDAAAFRRQCAIPPDQLAKLNSLPGWARAMQTASLDETPDGSPTPSQQPANEVAQPRRRPARGGAFLREQAARAPRLVDDDSDDSDSDSDPAVNAARVVQSMRDPQMRGLRGVATATPPAATDEEMARAAVAASREAKAARAAASPSRAARPRDQPPASSPQAIAPTQLLPDEEAVAPTQAAPPSPTPEEERRAGREQLRALTAMVADASPALTRAGRRRKAQAGGTPGVAARARAALAEAERARAEARDADRDPRAADTAVAHDAAVAPSMGALESQYLDGPDEVVPR